MSFPSFFSPTDPHEDDESSDEPYAVISFNVSDPSGAGGIAADIAAIAAMAGHCLPITTGVLWGDSSQINGHIAIDDEAVLDQAQQIMEDIDVAAAKIGFLGSADTVKTVAQIMAAYPDIPVITYIPSLPWLDETEVRMYLSAVEDHLLAQTMLLVGHHNILADWLLPDWTGPELPSPKELAQEAAKHGARFVLVTGILSGDTYLNNILASADQEFVSEHFARLSTPFRGAGDTVSAAIAALLACDKDLSAAVSEGLIFLDHALESGFQLGMGFAVPDRFFWALEEEDIDTDDAIMSGEVGPSSRMH